MPDAGSSTTGLTPNEDVDDDGVIYCEDNCLVEFNPEQADLDEDGVGDICDNCPWVSNTDQVDSNENGIGDACEGNSMPEMNAVGGITSYPNPAREELYVTCTNSAVRNLRLVDVTGKVVLETPVIQRIDLQDVAQGTYVFMALDAEGRPLAQARFVRLQ